MRGYWLFKSEPDAYPIGWLKKEKKAAWTGVRNYTARNFLRDQVKKGDGILFYHSSCPEPGVAGLAEVTRGPRPDPTQFDSKSPYFDAKATPTNPRWFEVEVAFKVEAKKVVPGALMKGHPGLAKMELFRQSRLSVTPVGAAQWKLITSMEGFW